MAVATLPKMGEYGAPCVAPCQHYDCAGTRRIATSPCSRCGKEIGYGVRFYYAPAADWQTLTHADCAEAKSAPGSELTERQEGRC